MPIRNNIIGPECISEYFNSGVHNIEAGFKLLVDGDAIGVSLMGLAVEMLLKSAYFSFVKSSDSEAISRIDLVDARKSASQFGIIEQDRQFHNLRFWCELLIAKHETLSPPTGLTVEYQAALRGAVARISQNWDITDRYQDIQDAAAPQDLQDVFEDAVTVWTLYPKLRN